MHFVALGQKKICKIRSVLSSNTSDECFFHNAKARSTESGTKRKRKNGETKKNSETEK
jgi:hypothetical protein